MPEPYSEPTVEPQTLVVQTLDSTLGQNPKPLSVSKPLSLVWI